MHSEPGDTDAAQPARRGVVRRRLLAVLALTAAVLLAHLALLQARPPQVAPRATPPAQQAFRIRTVDVEPGPAAAAPAAIETTAFEPAAGGASALPPEAMRNDKRSTDHAAPAHAPARAPQAPPRRIARFERNRAEAQAAPSQYAINSIVNTGSPAATTASERRAPATASVTPEAPDPIAAATPAPEASAPPAAPASAPLSAPPSAPDHAAPQAPTAFRIAPPARLDYDVHGQIRGIAFQAQAELLWRHDAGHYDTQLAIEVPLIGTRRQTSTGQIDAQGLEPTRFSDKARSEQAAHFVRPADGSAGHVVFSANTPQAALEPGAQDRLSVFLQLGAMLAAAPERYPRGSTIALQIVGPRDADPWRFEVGGSERLALPYGAVEATQLTRTPPRDYDTRVDLWLAPSLNWLPVRILLTRPRGEQLDLRLRTLSKPD